ncbi:MAG: FMN-binding glutamate synthase family protein [Deltaproteobacteria bacterium]|nr:FMN-binding glutamate synthase family protein [Deltaproteobacteria bacterium]MBW1954718.1 FMN-binding glutamate synthase family protein [Deltaproteobacteria bacterium]MBW2040569.1 FMN-binding glutamate synthase family protein [Deltaproteobacteria bacterium]MBW2131436.1 FMN-binding glutamate synthase family protein [Deltaproteobacteria bacterium]
MNLQQPNSNEALQTKNRSRSVAPQSGICSRCMDGCKGNCDMFVTTFRGRELLYPSPFGQVTAGSDKDYPVDYSHLNIMGYAIGASGIEADPDHAVFPKVSTETWYGATEKIKMKVPIFTGALGSTEIARSNWEQFAVGAAISGISLVCGENVCGIDPDLQIDKSGKVVESPEMRRRVDQYRRYQEGYGDVMVQMNVEDTRLGVAEYVIEKLGVQTIELKWGQGAKSIGGEIKVDSLERAIDLKKRGYIVTPDPTKKSNQEAFKEGAIKEFERHSRVGFLNQDAFMKEVDRVRKLGAKRVTLKTGAYPMRELAMAIRWSSDAKIDLLTIDGAPGGTGMSPWRMMCEWGIPAIYLHSMAYELCLRLAQKGAWIPDIAFAGGFSAEDHIFKALALGAPFCKAVCMGRALMIPGMVGKNIERWLKGEDGGLPSTVSKYGTTKEEIFVTYQTLRDRYGKEAEAFPLGAIGVYTASEKLRVGLQQLMAGARKWRTHLITRRDLASLTEECTKVTGIPYIMDAYREEALAIIDE